MTHQGFLRRASVAATCTALGVAALSGTSFAAQTNAGLRHGKHAASNINHAASNISIGFILKPISNPYFATMDNGAQAEAKKLGVHLTVAAGDSLTDPTQQANALAALVTHQYSCYIANPVDATNLVVPLIQAQRQHKPIVNIDLPISKTAASAAGVHIDTYIGTNNIQAGEMAATRLANMLPAHAQVAIIGGLASDSTSQARIQGFREGAGHKLDIVQQVAGNWVRADALNDATTLLQKYPKLKGFFVANGDMAIGVQRAIGSAKKQGKVDTIAVIGDTTVIQEVKSHTMASVVEQFPYAIGQLGVEACVAAVEDKPLPTSVATPVELVTSGNAGRALKAFPRPFGSYSDPFAKFLGH